MTSTLLPAGTPTRVFGDSHLRTDGDLALLAFAADGTLWSLEEPGMVRHWSAIGQPLETHTLSELEMLWAFSQGARVVASASQDLTLWDTTTGRVLTNLPQESWVTALTIHPSSAYLATGHDDGTIRYWDFAGQLAVHTLRHHKKPISALALHADGKTLAAASEDRTISLWDVSTGKHLRTLTGHTDRIPALAWHPKDHVLVSAGWDTAARVWDALAGTPIILLNDHAAQVHALAFSPDGKWLASADSAQKIHVWDFAAKKSKHVLTGPAVEIRSLAFSPDNTTLASTGDRTIHLWNAATGQSALGSERRGRVKPSVAVSADGARLATNAGGAACQIWSVASGAAEKTLADKQTIHQVAFSPAGPWVAAAAVDHVRVWNAATGAVHKDLDGPEQPLHHLAFSPDATILAAAGYADAAVWLWSVKDGEPLLIIPDPLQGCAPMSLAFHPQGQILAVAGVDWLATGGSSGAISLWDLKDRTETASVFDGATSLAFHPKGHRLAASTLDRSIALFDAVTLELQAELVGHDAAVTCLAYSPAGLLASGSDDQTIRLWTDAGDEAGILELDSKATALAFSPDGKSLFVAHANTTCSQYRIG